MPFFSCQTFYLPKHMLFVLHNLCRLPKTGYRIPVCKIIPMALVHRPYIAILYLFHSRFWIKLNFLACFICKIYASKNLCEALPHFFLLFLLTLSLIVWSCYIVSSRKKFIQTVCDYLTILSKLRDLEQLCSDSAK